MVLTADRIPEADRVIQLLARACTTEAQTGNLGIVLRQDQRMKVSTSKGVSAPIASYHPAGLPRRPSVTTQRIMGGRATREASGQRPRAREASGPAGWG